MHFIAIFPSMPWRLFDMLYNGAAKINVDDLHSFANTQNRTFPFYKKLQRLKLDDVQLGVDVLGTLIFLSEKCGCNISPSGEQKGVVIEKRSRIHGGYKIDFHRMKGFFVIRGVFGPSDDGDFRGEGAMIFVGHDDEVLSARFRKCGSFIICDAGGGYDRELFALIKSILCKYK